MTAVYGYMLYYVRYVLSSFCLTTALSWFQTVLDYYDNFTLNSIFRPKAIIKKNMHFNVNYKMVEHRDYVVDIEVHVFLIKAFGRNIELRVKLSYVFNIVSYGI